MDPEPPFPAPAGFHWIKKMEIRHWRSGQMMRRKDGKCFVILCRDKRQS
jgi:hypothetical protein